MHKLQNSQRGAVAMITVIFIAILLTVLTTGFIRLTINEQREAIDDDLTTRAFYAAESGVQDAIVAIKEYRAGAAIDLNEEDCLPAEASPGVPGSGLLSSVDKLDSEYTCQKIDTVVGEYVASVSENSSIFIPLIAVASDGSPANFSAIKLDWHINDDPTTGDGKAPGLRTDRDLPAHGEWGTVPAMLRTELIWVPNNNVTRNNVRHSVNFLNPESSSGVSSTDTDGSIIGAACDNTVDVGEYVCSMTYNVSATYPDSGYNYFLRVRPLYAGTHLKIELESGIPGLELAEAQAKIDVTGRAGDVFRRVEARVDLISGDLLPDFAILSAEDICKDFSITNDGDDFDSVNSASRSGSCQNPSP